jgi:hypothetical protein
MLNVNFKKVGRSRDRFPVSPGIFPMASDSSMCPGVDSASENEYQDNPGGKGCRCVRLTTYRKEIWGALTSWKPVQACNGTIFTNIPPIMIINRIYELQNLLSL